MEMTTFIKPPIVVGWAGKLPCLLSAFLLSIFYLLPANTLQAQMACTADAEETVIAPGQTAPGCLKDPFVATGMDPDGTGQASCARLRFDLTGFEDAGCELVTLTLAQGCGMGGGTEFIAYYYDAVNDACNGIYGMSDMTTGAITIDLTDPLVINNNYTIIVCRPGMGPVNVVNVEFDCVECIPSISIQTETGEEAICEGESIKLLAVTAGGQGDCTIQWQLGPAGGPFTDIPGATGTELIVTPDETTTYRATYTCDSENCPVAISNEVTITVYPTGTASLSADPTSVCEGEDVDLTFSFTGGLGPYDIVLMTSEGVTDTRQVVDGEVIPFGPVSLGATTVFISSATDANGCPVDVSDASVTITGIADPELSLTINGSSEAAVCEGDMASLAFAASGGIGCTYDLTYDFVTLPGVSPATGFTGVFTLNGEVPDDGVIDLNTVLSISPGVWNFYLSVDCTGEGCEADPLQVTLIVQPNPELKDDAQTAYTFCSREPISIDLAALFEEDFPEGYELSFPDYPGGIYAVPAGFENKGPAPVVIDLLETATLCAPDGELCCELQFGLGLTILPEPVGADDEVTTSSCINLEYDLQANVDNLGNGIESEFEWYVKTDLEGVTGEEPFVGPGNAVTGDVIDVTLNNTTNAIQTIIFVVTPTSVDGCEGMPFEVTVLVSPWVEETGCLACNDQVNITLNNQCEVTVTLDMVAEGNGELTCENYEELKEALEVIVYDDYYEDNGGVPDNVISQCGLFNYEIKLRDDYDGCINWVKCWGTILAEDKTPPEPYCAPPVSSIDKYTDGTGNIQFTPFEANSDWFEDDKGYAERIGRNYLICDDLDKVLDVAASWSDPSYPYYTGEAHAEDACMEDRLRPVKVEDELQDFQCDFSENGYGFTAFRIDRTFYFEDEKGNKSQCTQQIYFTRPYIQLPVCKVTVNACEYDGELRTDDLLTNDRYAVPFYVNGVCDTVYLTPDPSESGTYTTQGHTCNYTVSYSDLVFPGQDNCGRKIVRTWSILDWCWNPSLGDYPQLVGAPSGYDPALYACYDFYEGWDDHLSVTRHNISNSEWENKKFSWEQLIIYTDEEAPTISSLGADQGWDGEYDAITISAGPFNCTAVIDLEDRLKITDHCAVKGVRYKLVGEEPDPKTGVMTPVTYGWTAWNNYVLAGVPAGVYALVVEAEDECGNLALMTEEDGRTVVVEDLVEPVAVCDDELNVSIGGPGTTNDGLARVTAADVDEGSWDNCQLAERHVRRNIEDECVDTYLDRVEGFASLAELTPVERADMGNQALLDEYPNAMVFYFSATPAAGGQLVLVLEEDGFFYTIWRDAVYFTCCDISADREDLVMIELRVTDTKGNYNICWLNTLIEDKLPPSCDVLNRTILCTELDFDPMDSVQVAGRFGAPEEVVELRDNCGATITEEVVWTPDNCGKGLIERVFTITDASARSTVCTQEIKVEEVNDYEIVLPGDDGSAGCGVEPERDISLQSTACDILAVNKDTTRFQALGEECFKMLITYRVINWCEYDGERTTPIEVPRDWDGDGDLEEDHIVRVAPGPDVDLLPDVAGRQVVTWTQADGDLEWIDADDYADPEQYTAGFWQFSQLIKVYDDVAPEITIENESLEFCAYGTPPDDCDGNVNIVFTVTDECTPNDTEVRSLKLDAFNEGNPQDLAGVLGYTLTKMDDNTYRITGKLPAGDHTFVLSTADGCGNLDGERIPFSVVDCKSPAPICIQTLTVDLMPVDADNDGTVDGGMNTVWANSFIAAPIDDCSPFDIPENVKYFVFKDKDLENGVESITLDSLNETHTSAVFTCDDEGTELLYVVALDAADNFDYCAVMAFVQPGIEPSPCGDTGGGGTISGLITDESVNAVAGVNVQLSGRASMSYLTDDHGDFAFSNLIEGYDYSITPGKDDDHLNGVSTFDLILISKHILGVKLLSSPYKMIAADVNKSNSITTLDLIQLRKLILNIDTEFSNNTSWRFVDAGYNFPNPANPWSEEFPEVKNINDLQDQLTGDFLAVKIGDVNGNAAVNGLQSADERGIAGTFRLSAYSEASRGVGADLAEGEHLMKAGKEYTIEFTSADIANIEGYQFTMTFDRSNVELVDILYGVAREENFGVFPSEGMITTSWNTNGSDFRLPTSDLPLFSLVLRAKSDVQLKDVLAISSRHTRAEAYSTAGETLDIALNFGAGAVARAGFELYQNQPNPFNGQTIIGFNLPEAAEATIKVNDLSGRLLRVIEGEFAKGYNQITLNSDDLRVRGVLSYTVETAEHTATRKMIVIE